MTPIDHRAVEALQMAMSKALGMPIGDKQAALSWHLLNEAGFSIEPTPRTLQEWSWQMAANTTPQKDTTQ